MKRRPPGLRGLVYDVVMRRRLPKDVAPTGDLAALARLVRFPVPPSAAHWRGRRHASSGRIGTIWYTVSALARFDDWSAIARAVEQLPRYEGGGTGIHRADEFVPPDLLASVEGDSARRGPYHLAQSLWAHERLPASPHSWICALADGPYMLASLSSEGVWF